MEKFSNRFEKIEQLLSEKRLQQALDLLNSMNHPEAWIKEHIDNIQLVYRSLLDYAIQDIEDKESTTILKNLIQKA